MCSAMKNSYFSRITYSDTSAELVEARGVLQVLGMFKTVTTTPEQPVNVSELQRAQHKNTKAKKYDQSTMSQGHCQNFRYISKYFPYIVIR